MSGGEGLNPWPLLRLKPLKPLGRGAFSSHPPNPNLHCFFLSIPLPLAMQMRWRN